MGLMEMVKGLFTGDGVAGVLESTGLGEHVESLTGQGGALAESIGIDPAQGAEGLTSMLPEGMAGGAADAVAGVTERVKPPGV